MSNTFSNLEGDPARRFVEAANRKEEDNARKREEGRQPRPYLAAVLATLFLLLSGFSVRGGDFAISALFLSYGVYLFVHARQNWPSKDTE